MATLVIETQSTEELKLVAALLKKMGIKSTKLTATQQEEIAELLWIKDADLTQTVDKKEILAKLSK